MISKGWRACSDRGMSSIFRCLCYFYSPLVISSSFYSLSFFCRSSPILAFFHHQGNPTLFCLKGNPHPVSIPLCSLLAGQPGALPFRQCLGHFFSLLILLSEAVNTDLTSLPVLPTSLLAGLTDTWRCCFRKAMTKLPHINEFTFIIQGMECWSLKALLHVRINV